MNLNPHDFVTRTDDPATIGMVVTTGAHIFDAGIDGKKPTTLLVAWIGGEASWEEPGDLQKVDDLAELVARGMTAVWDHGSDSGRELTLRRLQGK
ncbi:MAG: hypothetical protein LUE17_09310 [Planctomycetaceae bacterium]|nr:hypothetical protein [Planctomycetaceae bacterium]